MHTREFVARPRSRRPFVLPVVAAAVWTSTVTAGAAPSSSEPAVAAAASHVPAGAAAAAHRREPRLPAPRGWGFPEAFSRTSGTGRMIGGALEWTDWVYDAYGATSRQAAPGNSITMNADSLSAAQGSYVYPAGPANNDGADIFRAAVGVTRSATVWRVDWNTLVTPSVPIAEWAFDLDTNARTGSSAWPAGANISSPGIERALVVTAKSARLVNTVSGATIATYRTAVDMRARSFLVTVPRHDLPVHGTWRIRLAAGLANTSDAGFAVPTLSGGEPASASAPRVYNVTFRTAAQEPPQYPATSTVSVARAANQVQRTPVVGAKGTGAAYDVLTANFWGEADQADTIAGDSVAKFSRLVTWRELEQRRTTTPPLLHGWTDRWYVSSLRLGQGVSGAANANPAFLGRVQPYAVYLPKTYTGARPVPLTWYLHSASVNYNQYGAVDPRLTRELCEDRRSICVTPEGFGGDGLYVGVAENDFWSVWREVARAFNVATDRTVVTGYSMGGLGSFTLPGTYPSVFSEAMPLDGGFDDRCSSAPAGVANFDITAAPDRSANVHWVPYVISDSYTDELSPYPNNAELVHRMASAGDRFTLYSTTTPEHVTTDLADGFSTQVASLHGTPRATSRPGTIDYTWCADAVDPKLGLGPTAVYWLSGLRQRTSAANATSRVVAVDHAVPERIASEQLAGTVVNPGDAPPMNVLTGSWQLGAAAPTHRELRLTLANVAGVTVDAAAALLPTGSATVTSDGVTTVTLTGLRAGTLVRLPYATARANADGRASVTIRPGATTITWTRH